MQLKRRVKRLERLLAELVHCRVAVRGTVREPLTPERLAALLSRRDEALRARIGTAIGADGAVEAARVKALAAFILDPRRVGWPLEVVVSRLCATEPELAAGLSPADLARAVGADRLDRSGTGPSSAAGCSGGACSASSPHLDDQ